MTEFESGPSSYSTLFFVPDYIAKHLDEKQDNDAPFRNTKDRFSDYETVAFVALRDTLQIDAQQLANLYNYNQRQYEALEAVIANSNTDYNSLINPNQVMILYHFFARVCDKPSWVEICNDLGFGLYFPSVCIDSLYRIIEGTQTRANGSQSSALRFFMKLLIFYSDAQAQTVQTMTDMHNSDIIPFWRHSLTKITKFISQLAIGVNIEVYCLMTQKWTSVTISKMNQSEHQVYAQYRDGSNQHQWFSIYSPRLAPIGFKYLYIPNIMKRNNVPCIVAVMDDGLCAMIMCNAPAPRNTNADVAQIPTEGWYYRCDVGNHNEIQIGPVSIAALFMACVERQIDQNTSVYHSQFGATKLQKLPCVVNAFRKHVNKCKENIIASHRIKNTTPASIFTASSNTSSANSNANVNNHNNFNVFIPETNVYRFGQNK